MGVLWKVQDFVSRLPPRGDLTLIGQAPISSLFFSPPDFLQFAVHSAPDVGADSVLFGDSAEIKALELRKDRQYVGPVGGWVYIRGGIN